MAHGPPKHPFAKLIGLHFSAPPQNGTAACWLEAGEHLHNPGGVLHGGVVFSMADTVMGAALWSVLPTGHSTSTIEMKINYLLPVISGRLDCSCKVLHHNETFGVIEAEVRSERGTVATALGTFAIHKRK